jgi:ribosomal protein S18 acetylase RimI-like enzyme
MSIHVRRAESRDLPRLAEIFARASVLSFPDEPPENSTPERLLSSIAGETLWLAELRDRTAGFVSVYRPDRERFIHHLYVDPEYWRQGVGRALLEAALRGTGGHAALKADVANRQACRFYDGLGWRPQSWGWSPEGPWFRYVR